MISVEAMRNWQMKSAMVTLGLALVFGACLHSHAMERWTALAQIESGNNDHALGLAGEVSRYQIKPRVWHRYASADANWRNAAQSLPIAKAAMRDRCAAFQRTFRRPPTDFEFYVLWNAPGQIRKPSQAVRKRAQRFCNLVNSDLNVPGGLVNAPPLLQPDASPMRDNSKVPDLKLTSK
jgi:hypothetical protein